ncbi:glycosyltransferase [Candidatus Pacearchaeota archaeon]|nr:glycosyltransferase [Candidatus Pacearchaeota archaeon]
MLVPKKPDKYKILTIGDHPLVPSGCGLQSKYIIEGLLKTDRYQFISFGAAIKHPDYRPVKIVEFGDDWVILPTDGYGNPVMLREVLDLEKPDALWFITDPRFYVWLFEMSDEVLDRNIPMLWWTIWDNFPTPQFNKVYYDSCTFLGCISKLTHSIVQELGFSDKAEYIPHAVDPNFFKILDEDLVRNERVKLFGKEKADSFILFYNSRNARRKKTSDAVAAFKLFADQIGDQNGEKCFFLMHCDPNDQEGANLFEVCKMLNLKNSQIVFSTEKLPFDKLAMLYNIADITITISAEEGYGLSCLESLMCGTPTIVSKTGGLQEFGAQLEPAAKLLVGSQQIPYIFSDHVSHEQVVDALIQMYSLTRTQRKELGKRARESVLKRYKLDKMVNQWDNAFIKYIKEFKENGNQRRVRLSRI